MDDRAHTPQRQTHSTPQSPNTDLDVAGLIARLLLHYYSPGDLSDSARKAMAQDWIEDLREFGASTVAMACQEWRRSQSRRPVPSEIRKLCAEMRRANNERRALSDQRVSDDYARSVGWASEAERREAIDADTRKRAERRVIAKAAQEELVLRGAGSLRTARSASADALKALGVTARETRREYDPEALRAGRIALGLEQPQAAE